MRSPLLSRSSRSVVPLAALTALCLGRPAFAEEPAHCEKVRARAASDAALLFAPTVQAQALKFPRTARVDTGPGAGRDYQVRAVVTWSPLDFYKGFRVLAVSEADCRAFTARMTLDELLRDGADYGRVGALRQEHTFLDARQAVWREIEARSEQRFAAHAVTLLEVNEVRARVGSLARRRELVRGEIELLEARGTPHVESAVERLVEQADALSMEFERQASHVRSLASWDVSVTGGVIPQEKPVDYFAMVQVGFNFGAFARNANERRYLDARSAELKKARYESREQLRRFREGVRAREATARRQLVLVEERLATLASARSSLDGADALLSPHALALIDLETIAAESERAYLSALISDLHAFEEKANAH